MKLYETITAFMLLAVCLMTCSAEVQEKPTPKVEDKPTLKVLDIGNSYTNDATNLLPLITEASGSDISNICLYKAIRSSASYKNWYDVWCDKDTTYRYRIEKVLGGLHANVSTGIGAKGDGSLFRKLLTEEKWDLIIVHQVSTYAPYYECWNGTDAGGYLDELLSVIKEHQPDAVIGCYILHSFWDNYTRNKEGSSYERWKLICSSIKEMQKDYRIDFIIPYGTAIENLRSSSLNNEYDLTRDGTHLGYGLCQYTAACCYYETLIAPRSGISVLGNAARYDASQAKSSTYPSISVTDGNAPIAQKAAVLATKHMFECINPETYNDILTDGKTIIK